MENKKANKKVNKKILFGGIGIIAVAAVLLLIYNVFMPKGSTGEKKIAVEVVYQDQSSDTFDIETDEEFLRGALEQEELIEGTESEYGLYVLTVNGVTADESKEEWWCFTKGGETLNTGVDMTPVADGEHFEITLTTGY